MVQALRHEIHSRKDEATDLAIETIYFGGGTPSVLTPTELAALLDSLYSNYKILPGAEITVETNPDDLSQEYLDYLKALSPVNRLSIGIQSFYDTRLKMMNRRHTARESKTCIEKAKNSGFENINIDLIYGFPGMSESEWISDLEIFRKFQIPHLSAYHLTFEPKTVFSHYMKKGTMVPVDEEISLQQYKILLDFAEENGYENYEISNFALPGKYSRHNLGYWTGKSYLGFGPSAHSYNGNTRRWNVSNNTIYLDAIENHKEDYFETEEIDRIKAFNEYLLTGLRTQWGISSRYIQKNFGRSFLDNCLPVIKLLLGNNTLIAVGDSYILSREGKMIADHVISELMVV